MEKAMVIIAAALVFPFFAGVALLLVLAEIEPWAREKNVGWLVNIIDWLANRLGP